MLGKVGGKDVCTTKRGHTVSEVASENAKMLALKIKKLAIARSHKQSRESIHPGGVTRVGLVTAIRLIKPAARLIKPAAILIKPLVSVISPAIRVVRPAVGLVNPTVS